MRKILVAALAAVALATAASAQLMMTGAGPGSSGGGSTPGGCAGVIDLSVGCMIPGMGP